MKEFGLEKELRLTIKNDLTKESISVSKKILFCQRAFALKGN